MRILATILAILLWALAAGLWVMTALFYLAARAPEAVEANKVTSRLVVAGFFGVGGLLLAAGGVFLLVLAFRKGSKAATAAEGGRTAQEAPGELVTRDITCPHCGGKADAQAMKIGKDGVMTLTCPYCGTASFVEEAPKW